MPKFELIKGVRYDENKADKKMANSHPKLELIRGEKKEGNSKPTNKSEAPTLKVIHESSKNNIKEMGDVKLQQETPKDKIKETVEYSNILEQKVFTRNEVVELIERVAIAEGFEKSELQIEKEYYDKKENLLTLWFKVTNEAAKRSGYNEVRYFYMIKGDLGKAGINYTTTSITRTAEGGETKMGGHVADYEDGKWHFSPQSIVARKRKQ